MSQNASYVNAFPNYRIRQTAQASQPRYIVAKRLNSVRLNWFMLGTLSGMVVCFAMNTIVGSVFSENSNASVPQLEASLQIETAESEIAAAEHPLEVGAPDRSIFDRVSALFASAPEAAPEDEAAAADVQVVQIEPAPQPVTYPLTVTHTLKKGETLTNILTNYKVDYQHAHTAITSLRKAFNPRDLKIGQELTFTLDEMQSGELVLSELNIKKNNVESVLLERNDAGRFSASSEKKPLQPKLTLAGGTITNSLFETGYASGIPDGILAELVQAYSYDVDFQREIQRGDKIEVLFEKMVTAEGDAAGHGDIVYATLRLRGEPLTIYRHKTKDGRAGFYNEKGESIIKALLKTPINGARISSGYGKRTHPIMGYTKMHKGTDFAAPTGTPIYAAGDGNIAFAGRKGGYGNYVQIKHNDTYATAYAHMHRFASGLRPGKPVRQGQVIGYVGSTGASTGPHLHYEVHRKGAQVNPMSEKFQTGNTLKGTELANFKQSISQIKQQVASMPREKTTVASAR